MSETVQNFNEWYKSKEKSYSDETFLRYLIYQKKITLNDLQEINHKLLNTSDYDFLRNV